jgi:uncharacterized protein (TIGR02594 family)
MKYNKAILAAAEEHLGLEEWPGARHNPAIVQMFADTGNSWVTDDETPWCAAFVGSVLGSLSIPHTGKLNARSYETWGTSVSIQSAVPGDVVVLWRGSPTSWQGHVGFFVGFSGDSVIIRGGNQGNKVSDAKYPRNRIVAIRRADGVVARGSRPVLRLKDSGAFVLDLQQQLVSLGYTLGEIDNKFGSRTLAAVVAFQADQGLEPDGVVGDATWAALSTAEPRGTRKVFTEKVEENSVTIKEAEKGKTYLGIGGGAAGVAVVAEVASAVQEARSTAELISGMAPTVIIALVIAGVVFLGYRQFNKVRERRIHDAVTGTNDRI